MKIELLCLLAIFFMVSSCGINCNVPDVDIVRPNSLNKPLPKDFNYYEGLRWNAEKRKSLGEFSDSLNICELQLLDTVEVFGYSKSVNPYFLATYECDSLFYNFLIGSSFVTYNDKSILLWDYFPGGQFLSISKELEGSDRYSFYLWANLFSLPIAYGGEKIALRNYFYLLYWPRLKPSQPNRKNLKRSQNLHFYKTYRFIKKNDIEKDVYLKYFRILFHFDFKNFSLKNTDTRGKNGKIQLIDLTNNKKYLIEYSMIFPFCYNLIPELDE